MVKFYLPSLVPSTLRTSRGAADRVDHKVVTARVTDRVTAPGSWAPSSPDRQDRSRDHQDRSRDRPDSRSSSGRLSGQSGPDAPGDNHSARSVMLQHKMNPRILSSWKVPPTPLLVPATPFIKFKGRKPQNHSQS